MTVLLKDTLGRMNHTFAFILFNMSIQSNAAWLYVIVILQSIARMQPKGKYDVAGGYPMRCPIVGATTSPPASPSYQHAQTTFESSLIRCSLQVSTLHSKYLHSIADESRTGETDFSGAKYINRVRGRT